MRRHPYLRSLVLAVLFGLAVAAPPWPQDYPARPIRLIVPSPAGSLVDVLSRLLAQDVAAPLGRSIVVDDRARAMTEQRRRAT
jgi:tripartite-type tricarboxylate transporter receptor subunit TctC